MRNLFVFFLILSLSSFSQSDRFKSKEKQIVIANNKPVSIFKKQNNFFWIAISPYDKPEAGILKNSGFRISNMYDFFESPERVEYKIWNIHPRKDGKILYWVESYTVRNRYFILDFVSERKQIVEVLYKRGAGGTIYESDILKKTIYYLE